VNEKRTMSDLCFERPLSVESNQTSNRRSTASYLPRSTLLRDRSVHGIVNPSKHVDLFVAHFDPIEICFDHEARFDFLDSMLCLIKAFLSSIESFVSARTGDLSRV
jgi:hypothetical protein